VELIRRSWLAIEGSLEPIDYDGPSWFRFPVELAELVIATYSVPDDWVLDPFCGFGTTLAAAARLNRNAIGFEMDPERGAWAAEHAPPGCRVVQAPIQTIGDHDLPPFDLLFTSPPYTSFRTYDPEGASHYFEDLRAIFGLIKPHLKPGATVVVEMSSVREADRIRTVAWDAAKVLSEIFAFQGEIVRCNTGAEPAGPGFDHSYLLVFCNDCSS
jgi:hypothetical protein